MPSQVDPQMPQRASHTSNASRLLTSAGARDSDSGSWTRTGSGLAGAGINRDSADWH
jgi:hypothetical protein